MSDRRGVLRSLKKMSDSRPDVNANSFLVNEIASLRRANERLDTLATELADRLAEEREKRHSLKQAVRQRLEEFDNESKERASHESLLEDKISRLKGKISKLRGKQGRLSLVHFPLVIFDPENDKENLRRPVKPINV